MGAFNLTAFKGSWGPGACKRSGLLGFSLTASGSERSGCLGEHGVSDGKSYALSAGSQYTMEQDIMVLALGAVAAARWTACQ